MTLFTFASNFFQKYIFALVLSPQDVCVCYLDWKYTLLQTLLNTLLLLQESAPSLLLENIAYFCHLDGVQAVQSCFEDGQIPLKLATSPIAIIAQVIIALLCTKIIL
jgi:hypothetical protein